MEDIELDQEPLPDDTMYPPAVLDPELEQDEVEDTSDTVDDEEIKKILLSIVEDVEKEEQDYRSAQLRVLRKLDLFWHGIQRLYWSESTNDFVALQDITDPEIVKELEGLDEVVNIYKAHGESIIAALSTGIPAVRYSPDDADNALDILTSKAYTRISELIQKRNKATLLFIKALFTLWNQHFVAAYHYSREDKKFGTYSETTYIEESHEEDSIECGMCGEELPAYDTPCPTCGSTAGFPAKKVVTESIPVENHYPKSSQEIEIFGPLNVLIQKNARTVADTGALILYTENDIAKVYSTFPELAEKLTPEPDTDEDAQVRAAHNSTIDTNNVTVKQAWLRPWMFWRLGHSRRDIIKQLYEKYPKGVFLTIIQKEVAEIAEESLDERWTLSESPVSRTVIGDPLGQGIISIQETINDLYSLSKETIRHGVPETFYDQNILDSEKYQSVQATPGMLFPVKRQAGQSIQDSFYQFKSATLSKEVDQFRTRNDSDAQFVTGAFPSIYGGPNEGSSGTLGEYALSKNMALQRLQITYKTLVDWWASIMSKVIPDFIDNMKDDERYTKPQGNSYINVVIKKEEAQSGKIGLVEPENSEQIPISWAQKKDLMIQLLQFNNETLNSAFFHPENANIVAGTLGFTGFYVPGEEDRTKQLIEISQLLRGEQISPEMDIDNHPIHVEVCRAWAKSTAGLEAKQENPQGYQNVLIHTKMHLQMIQPQLPPGNGSDPNQSPNEEGKPNPKSMPTPETTPEPQPVQ